MGKIKKGIIKMEKNKTTYIGIGFCDVLAIAFIILKLLNIITWSWIWVLAPLWFPIALILGIFIIAVIITLIRDKIKEVKDGKNL